MAELLAGTDPDRRDDLWLAIGSLPWAEIDQPAWRSIGEVANDLRRAGVSVPLTDIAIAVAAADAEAPLWTNDRDFQRIQEVFPVLELHADIGEAIVQAYTRQPQAEGADEELGQFPPPAVDSD